MEHFYIGLTFDRLDMTPYVIRGDIATAEDFENKIEFNGTLDFETFQTEYNISVDNFKLDELRTERDQLIAETDWRATIDYPGDDQAAWLEYRQALRDITNTYTSLDNVVWPVPPGESNGS